jgi:hypothetical protein
MKSSPFEIDMCWATCGETLYQTPATIVIRGHRLRLPSLEPWNIGIVTFSSNCIDHESSLGFAIATSTSLLGLSSAR